MTGYIEQNHLFTFPKQGRTTLCTSYTATQKALPISTMTHKYDGNTIEDEASSRTKRATMSERFVRLSICVCPPLRSHDSVFPSHKKHRPTTEVCFLPHMFLLPLILRLVTQVFLWVHANL